MKSLNKIFLFLGIIVFLIGLTSLGFIVYEVPDSFLECIQQPSDESIKSIQRYYQETYNRDIGPAEIVVKDTTSCFYKTKTDYRVALLFMLGVALFGIVIIALSLYAEKRLRKEI